MHTALSTAGEECAGSARPGRPPWPPWPGPPAPARSIFYHVTWTSPARNTDTS
ncbi:unnamed protein product [Plutella xylostella]|uniref:(diamondback moth) hypothetical protein n=1 Tax=Plutella xylostella TaxID=51655 RepID=A0A8S4EDC9_PLUXY|nr:unnamed protein product [Plutella xylostella]